MQISGSWATRAATLTRPDQTMGIKVTARSLIVPFVGVYSIGVDLAREEEIAPALQPEVSTGGLKYHRMSVCGRSRKTSQ
ncbi:hypothetical protein VZT92_020245 [Zoarces viviparus]|uniref:Uncharacterized protein n=1 Tax=Zoarces viviparus TaxID=48416 RepID=A0AAW1EDP0_ZOAVI